VGAAGGVALAAATILLAFGRGACALAESAAGVCPVEIDKAEIDSLVAQGFLNPGAEGQCRDRRGPCREAAGDEAVRRSLVPLREIPPRVARLAGAARTAIGQRRDSVGRVSAVGPWPTYG
jgi:hypothetical protein